MLYSNDERCQFIKSIVWVQCRYWGKKKKTPDVLKEAEKSWLELSTRSQVSIFLEENKEQGEDIYVTRSECRNSTEDILNCSGNFWSFNFVKKWNITSNGRYDFGKFIIAKVTKQTFVCHKKPLLTFKRIFASGALREMIKIVVKGLNLERHAGEQ